MLSGYEKALGAALSDDLKAPAVSVDGLSGWTDLIDCDFTQVLPTGIESFGQYVTVPGVLKRRISQVGLVTPADGARLHEVLLPGQRLVSLEGDLWRWDGFRAQAKDAPSAAALALEQRNRLKVLQQELAAAQAEAYTADSNHEILVNKMQILANSDQDARVARRAADGLMADAGRAVSRAEAERNLAGGRVEALALAVTRHGEDAAETRLQLRTAQTNMDGLEDLVAARLRVEEIKLSVEASRVTMMSRRAAHDVVRSDGEARDKRIGLVAKDIFSWVERLGNATARADELVQRHTRAEVDLTSALSEPEPVSYTHLTLPTIYSV